MAHASPRQPRARRDSPTLAALETLIVPEEGVAAVFHQSLWPGAPAPGARTRGAGARGGFDAADARAALLREGWHGVGHKRSSSQAVASLPQATGTGVLAVKAKRARLPGWESASKAFGDTGGAGAAGAPSGAARLVHDATADGDDGSVDDTFSSLSSLSSVGIGGEGGARHVEAAEAVEAPRDSRVDSAVAHDVSLALPPLPLLPPLDVWWPPAAPRAVSSAASPAASPPPIAVAGYLVPHPLKVPPGGAASPPGVAAVVAAASPDAVETGMCVGMGSYGAVYLARKNARDVGVVKVYLVEAATPGTGSARGRGGGAASYDDEAADDVHQSDEAADLFNELFARQGGALGDAEGVAAMTAVVRAGDDWRLWATLHPAAPLTLAHALFAAKPLPVGVVRELARQLLRIVSRVHARGVAHRDIKPANVLVTVTPAGAVELRLTDMGLATPRERCVDANVITIWWRPPEVLARMEYDPSAADVWSVGVMLRDWLCGRHMLGSVTDNAQTGAALAMVLQRRGIPTAAQWPEGAAHKDVRAAAAALAPGAGRVGMSLAADRATWRACLYGSMRDLVPDHAGLDAFLDRLLTLNPAARPTAATALADAFLTAADTPEEAAEAGRFWADVADHARRGVSRYHHASEPTPTTEATASVAGQQGDAGTTAAVAWDAAGASSPKPVRAMRAMENALLASTRAPTTLVDSFGAPPAGATNGQRAACVADVVRIAANERGWGALTAFVAVGMLDRALAAAAVPDDTTPLVAAAALFLAHACTVERCRRVSLGAILGGLGIPAAPASLAAARQCVAELAATVRFSLYGGSGESGGSSGGSEGGMPLHATSLYHALRRGVTAVAHEFPEARSLRMVATYAVYIALFQLCTPTLHGQSVADLAGHAVAEAAAWVRGQAGVLGAVVGAKLTAATAPMPPGTASLRWLIATAVPATAAVGARVKGTEAFHVAEALAQSMA